MYVSGKRCVSQTKCYIGNRQISPPFLDVTARRDNTPEVTIEHKNQRNVTPTEDFSCLQIASRPQTPSQKGGGDSRFLHEDSRLVQGPEVRIDGPTDEKLLSTLDLISPLPVLQRTASRTTVSLENVDLWESDSEAEFDQIDGVHINPKKTFDFSDLGRQRIASDSTYNRNSKHSQVKSKPSPDKLPAEKNYKLTKEKNNTDMRELFQQNTSVQNKRRNSGVFLQRPLVERQKVIKATKTEVRRTPVKVTTNKTSSGGTNSTHSAQSSSKVSTETNYSSGSSSTHSSTNNVSTTTVPLSTTERTISASSKSLRLHRNISSKDGDKKRNRHRTHSVTTAQCIKQSFKQQEHEEEFALSLNRTYDISGSSSQDEQITRDSLETKPKRTKPSSDYRSPTIPPIPSSPQKKQVKFHGIVRLKQGDTDSYDFLRLPRDTAGQYKKKYLAAMYSEDDDDKF